ncbi:hypothetical protein [Streptomyces rishiriensis]
MTWHSAAGLDALPVARMHPPVRDTGRPAPGPDLPAPHTAVAPNSFRRG